MFEDTASTAGYWEINTSDGTPFAMELFQNIVNSSPKHHAT
jgi:hypothetical protein